MRSLRNTHKRSRAAAAAVGYLCLAGATPLMGQAPPTEELEMTGQPVPGLERIRVEEHLLDSLPLDATLTNHLGEEVRLGDYFDGERPVILSFAYHSCPTLCSMVLDATVNSVKDTVWTAGDEYQIITISIDPRDTPEVARNKRREILERYGRLDEAADGWDFLVGDDDTLREIARAAGYHYFWDGNQQQYGHPAAIMLVTPDGRLARYLYGLRFEPNDVRLGLLEASEGRSISTGEHFLLYCYAYNPQEGGYTVVVMNIMRLSGLATVTILGGVLFVFWRRERKKLLIERRLADGDDVTSDPDPGSDASSPTDPSGNAGSGIAVH